MNSKHYLFCLFIKKEIKPAIKQKHTLNVKSNLLFNKKLLYNMIRGSFIYRLIFISRIIISTNINFSYYFIYCGEIFISKILQKNID